MELEEAVKYVAAAYGVILVAVIAYVVMAARRVSAVERDVRLLDETIAKREGRHSHRRPGPWRRQGAEERVEHLEVICLWIAILLYSAAFVFFLYYFLSKRERLNRMGLLLAVGGWAFQTAALVLRGINAGHAPVVGAYESMSLAAWFVVTVYLILELRTRMKAIGLYVMPAVAAFLTIAWLQYDPPKDLMPALKSDVVALHVAVIFAAVGAFTVAGGAALLYLIEEWRLKRRKAGMILGGLPSLDTLDKLVYHAILFGLPFLSMGIVAGVIRAERFGVRSWYTDPLVLLALIAWAIYALFLYGRMSAGWRGRKTAYLALLGLACLLIIRFAAVPYLSDFHTFGG